MKPSLYIHIPFCSRKCPYCSFPVVIGQERRMMDYVSALLGEMRAFHGQEISTVYVGGGTPSHMDARALAVLCDGLKAHARIDADERTFEFNPESVVLDKALQVRSLGFGRASLGLQSFNEGYLSYLGRGHHAQQGVAAFHVLRKAGFDNISIDLMFGFPDQTMPELDADIDAALALGSEHLSIYALTVEDKSLFAVRGESVRDEVQAAFYRRILARLKEAGFEQYEVSNFTRPGFASRHNINYWEGGAYIGLGMGAHGHLQGRRYWNADTFPKYMQMIAERGVAIVGEECLPPLQKMMEGFLFGLRMNAGVDMDILEARFGVRFDTHVLDEIRQLAMAGMVEVDGRRIRATDAGRLVLDEISVRLL